MWSFVQILARDDIRMRVWERGSGETVACGTGACASLVASVLCGHADRAATLHLRGGDLSIRWDEESDHVFMRGPAAFVFDGEVGRLNRRKMNGKNREREQIDGNKL